MLDYSKTLASSGAAHLGRLGRASEKIGIKPAVAQDYLKIPQERQHWKQCSSAQ
jgi:hypothetical protein